MFSGKKQKNAPNDNRDIIAEIIVEEYRFLKSYESAVSKLFPEERQKYVSAYNFHVGKINEIAASVQIGIRNFEGKDYDDGLPVTPLNLDEFGKDDILFIQQTIEPTIMSVDGEVIRNGSVILAKRLPKKPLVEGLPEMKTETTTENQTEGDNK